MAAGIAITASAYQLLRHGSTYDQLVTAVNTCVLPAGVKLMQIAEGSVILKVQAENISALDSLWSLYTDGKLRKSLQVLLVTDKMREELVSGEHVNVIVDKNTRKPGKSYSLKQKVIFFQSMPMISAILLSAQH